MDLLGSILNSMDKPPEVDEKRKEQMKSAYYLLYLLFGFRTIATYLICRLQNKKNKWKSNKHTRKERWPNFEPIAKSASIDL